MIAKLAALVMAGVFVVFALSACASPADEPESVEEQSASESEVQQAQAQQESVTAYQAGQSETETASDESQANTKAIQPEAQTSAEQPAQQDTSEQARADQTTQTVSVDNDQPMPQAMVSNVIASGHRAGLFADRNVVGDPDAPIVITEYSDFL